MASSASRAGQRATLGFEAILWKAADKLRGHMDAAEYKHVVLGLIFLKYISDAFARRRAAILADPASGADPEDQDEYIAEGVFWVPPEARWATIQDNAPQETIGVIIDRAMEAIERDNRTLRDVLPKGYARPTLDKRRLGELVDLIGKVELVAQGQPAGEGQLALPAPEAAAPSAQDILGRVYEYFLGQFASAEGKQGGEFYTPAAVVRVLVAMLAPYRGRIYDPCCGSGGMFVQSERFVEAHGGRIGDVAIYGQESNPTTWKLAKMNLAIRGIEADLGRHNADTFHQDLHPDLRADYILANPPFNISDWGGERLRQDKRWQYGAPPVGNANYAWVQHILYHLAPTGVAGFVLANGSLSSNTSGEGEIRKTIVEADLVDCIVALPGQLFYSTQIPVSLWFLAHDKRGGRGLDGRPLWGRRGEVLFIDARALGYMEDRTHRSLSDEEIARIADTYHAWRGDGGAYADVPGFCKAVMLAEIRGHGHVLTPGRYVGAAATEEDDEPFAEKLERLTAALEEQFAESSRLEATIRDNLQRLGRGE
ncbi:MAG TPA: class I SAM-dependent DNA methyltransferase [Thermomicrobiales bacterium]|nr:class I SAM-dependent DNA methyltransferase [Thermomicrobiales bacterium]